MGLLTTFTSKISRKKFLATNMMFIGGITFINKWTTKLESPKRVKLLTKEGNLVEVDADKLPTKRNKISTDQLASWIWKNNKF